MSILIVEAILSKAMSDARFAEALFADAEKALAGYDLTTEELAKFQKFPRAQFQSMTIEERKSFIIDFANHNETALSI